MVVVAPLSGGEEVNDARDGAATESVNAADRNGRDRT